MHALICSQVESELTTSSSKLPAGVQLGPELAAAPDQPTTSSSTADEWAGFKQPQVWGLGSGGPFASMSLSMGVGRASKAVLGVFNRAAKRAPVLSAPRPRLVRPSMMQQQMAKQQQAGTGRRQQQPQQQKRQGRCV